MKTFAKLNLFAFLYGFVFFIQTELMVNISRLERITQWYNNTIGDILALVIFIGSTIIFVYITGRYFNKGGLKYLLTILWIPYCAILVYLFTSLLPMTNHQDFPTPAVGLILMGVVICYPFYIAIINVIITLFFTVDRAIKD
jgi:hypothetical protein